MQTLTRQPGTVTPRGLRAAVQRGLRANEGRRFTVHLTSPVERFTYPGGAAGLRATFDAVLPDGSHSKGVATFTRHDIGRPGAGTLDVRPAA